MTMAGESPAAVHAYLIADSGEFVDAWIVEADSRKIIYRQSEASASALEAKRSDFGSIYFFGLPDLKEALALYRGGRYAEAKERFEWVEKRYSAIAEVPENPSTIAGFHRLECLRNLGDLDGLAAALQTFRNRGLVRESHLRQLELYVLWDAVRTEQWEKLEALAAPRMDENLPAPQLVQVAYCRGLALEKLGREREAADAYQRAIVLGDAATDPLVKVAILRVLEMDLRNPNVAKFLKQRKSGMEADLPARRRLREAAALAKLFESLPGNTQSLPEPLRPFLDHSPSEPTPDKP